MRRVLSVAAVTILAALPLGWASPSQADAVLHRVHIVRAASQVDPPGPDHQPGEAPTNTKLNQEYIVIRNDSPTIRHLGGWLLRDASGHVYTFHHLRLGPGHKVTVHTGSGTDTHRDRYWGERNYVWNNDGDAVQLINRGQVVISLWEY